MFSKQSRNQSHTMPPAKRSADTVVTPLAQVWPTALEPEVARLFDFGFAWFSDANRREAMQHVQAATIAYDRNLSQQLALHLREAQTITLRDLADRVQAAVMKLHGYQGPRYFYPFRISGPFIVREYDETFTCYEWHYSRIDQFGRLIPAPALATLALLEKAGLHPQACWVADKRRQASVLTIDPILSTQFGPWFVAVAEWV